MNVQKAQLSTRTHPFRRRTLCSLPSSSSLYVPLPGFRPALVTAFPALRCSRIRKRFSPLLSATAVASDPATAAAVEDDDDYELYQTHSAPPAIGSSTSTTQNLPPASMPEPPYGTDEQPSVGKMMGEAWRLYLSYLAALAVAIATSIWMAPGVLVRGIIALPRAIGDCYTIVRKEGGAALLQHVQRCIVAAIPPSQRAPAQDAWTRAMDVWNHPVLSGARFIMSLGSSMANMGVRLPAMMALGATVMGQVALLTSQVSLPMIAPLLLGAGMLLQSVQANASLIIPRIGVLLMLLWGIWFATSVIENTWSVLSRQGRLDSRTHAGLVATTECMSMVLSGIVALSALGVNLSALLLPATVLMAVLTKDLLANMVAGIYLYIAQPFRVGDQMSVVTAAPQPANKVADIGLSQAAPSPSPCNSWFDGICEKVDLRYTVIRSGRRRLMVPNATFITREFAVTEPEETAAPLGAVGGVAGASLQHRVEGFPSTPVPPTPPHLFNGTSTPPAPAKPALAAERLEPEAVPGWQRTPVAAAATGGAAHPPQGYYDNHGTPAMPYNQFDPSQQHQQFRSGSVVQSFMQPVFLGFMETVGGNQQHGSQGYFSLQMPFVPPQQQHSQNQQGHGGMQMPFNGWKPAGNAQSGDVGQQPQGGMQLPFGVQLPFGQLGWNHAQHSTDQHAQQQQQGWKQLPYIQLPSWQATASMEESDMVRRADRQQPTHQQPPQPPPQQTLQQSQPPQQQQQQTQPPPQQQPQQPQQPIGQQQQQQAQQQQRQLHLPLLHPSAGAGQDVGYAGNGGWQHHSQQQPLQYSNSGHPAPMPGYGHHDMWQGGAAGQFGMGSSPGQYAPDARQTMAPADGSNSNGRPSWDIGQLLSQGGQLLPPQPNNPHQQQQGQQQQGQQQQGPQRQQQVGMDGRHHVATYAAGGSQTHAAGAGAQQSVSTSPEGAQRPLHVNADLQGQQAPEPSRGGQQQPLDGTVATPDPVNVSSPVDAATNLRLGQPSGDGSNGNVPQDRNQPRPSPSSTGQHVPQDPSPAHAADTPASSDVPPALHAAHQHVTNAPLLNGVDAALPTRSQQHVTDSAEAAPMRLLQDIASDAAPVTGAKPVADSRQQHVNGSSLANGAKPSAHAIHAEAQIGTQLQGVSGTGSPAASPPQHAARVPSDGRSSDLMPTYPRGVRPDVHERPSAAVAGGSIANDTADGAAQVASNPQSSIPAGHADAPESGPGHHGSTTHLPPSAPIPRDRPPEEPLSSPADGAKGDGHMAGGENNILTSPASVSARLNVPSYWHPQPHALQQRPHGGQPVHISVMPHMLSGSGTGAVWGVPPAAPVYGYPLQQHHHHHHQGSATPGAAPQHSPGA